MGQSRAETPSRDEAPPMLRKRLDLEDDDADADKPRFDISATEDDKLIHYIQTLDFTYIEHYCIHCTMPMPSFCVKSTMLKLLEL